MSAFGNRLSVVILARDAADALRPTLASIRDIADEIVVVDTGSTDKTRDVAQEFGASLTEFSWTDDFSAARNYASQQAQGDWLLWLDAGETLNDADALSLKQFVSTQAAPEHAYFLLVRLPAVDASSSPEQIARVRLMPRHPAVRFSGRVWESPVESLVALGVTLVGLPYVIRRGGRDLDTRSKKQRARRNMRLAELELQDQRNVPRCWNCLGDALQTLGDRAKAADCFRRALANSERGSQEMLEAYYGLLTSLGNTPAEQEEQFQECTRALDVFPLDAQLLCALGGYLQSRGHTQLAGKAYLTGFQFGQVTPTAWHVSEIREVAAVCHSLTLQIQGASDAAMEFLENALVDHPESVRVRRRLIDVFIERGDRDSALAHVAKLPTTTPHLEAVKSAVRGACFAVQQNLIAAKAYLQAAYTHGCRDPLCLKWLSLCLLSTGERDAARSILLEWQQREPSRSEVGTLLATLAKPAIPVAVSAAPVGAPTGSAAGATTTLRLDLPGNAAGGPGQPIKLNLPSWSPAANDPAG